MKSSILSESCNFVIACNDRRLKNYKRKKESWVTNRSSLKNNNNFDFLIHFVHFEVNTFYPIHVLSTGIFTGSTFILLRLNPFDFSVGREEWWFQHSVT